MMTPITTAADPWVSPLPGHWRRDFRLGEWLTGPVSPSFASWLVPEIERGFDEATKREYGFAMKLPAHVVINGWYFAGTPKVKGIGGAFVRRPRAMFDMFRASATMVSRPENWERTFAEPTYHDYRDRDLPAHRDLIVEVSSRLDTATLGELVEDIDRLGYSTGGLMLAMVQTMGFAGKAEFALADFHAKNLRPTLGTSHLDLLVGLDTPGPPADHAVVSLDWIEPTAAEVDHVAVDHGAAQQALAERRRGAEAACRAALADRPKEARRFDELLAVAQRWIPIRETMAGEFTLAWPTLRAAMTHMGQQLEATGVIASAADVYLLERDEIVALVGGSRHSLAATVEGRREQRQAQARLAPPMSVGKATGPWRKVDKYFSVYRLDRRDATRVLVSGVPTSAGTATGSVRVVLGPDDFDAFAPGEILVAPITAPAWTPLFKLAAAVITDSGSPFAHASVIAREYGIPAVVGTGDGTVKLHTGQRVTVDGDRGIVEPA